MDWRVSNVARYGRTLLILGRTSNLPTVWSNCLAGWLVAGGWHTERFVLLNFGATFLYLAGMFLNDAFDAHFDRQHRPERPIPSGAIAASAVWQWGFAWFVLGLLCFGLLGFQPLLWALLLGASILLYDAIHKIFFLSPVLMAACRLFLILAAASVTDQGITGYSVWCALVLACYIIGVTCLARGESRAASLLHWPILFLAAPVLLAWIVNRGSNQILGAILSIALILWVLASLRHTLWSPQPHIGRSVSGLLAGITLVDLLAVGGGSIPVVLTFLALFALALLFQRFIPAT